MSHRLITDEALIHSASEDFTHLIKQQSHIISFLKGKFYLVGFFDHRRLDKVSPLIQKAIDLDIGIMYVCTELPSQPIIDPHIVYVQVPNQWFIHTLFFDPLKFKGVLCGRASIRLAQGFSSFTKYRIPIIRNEIELQKQANKFQEKSADILLEITGGVGDHLMCIPTIKTLAKKFNKRIYILCEKHRVPCFDNLDYISGFYHDRNTIDVSNFENIYYLHFGQILNDYSMDVNKQNRIYSVANLCGLKAKDLVITRPEIIFTEKELQVAKQKYGGYKNKVFFGFDSNRIDARMSVDMAQRQITRLKAKGFSVFTSSLKEYNISNCINLTKQLTVRELFSLIAVMDYVLTIDTAFLHIAGALEKVTFALINYFDVTWRCSTYVNMKTYTPHVDCYPCVAGQRVHTNQMQCLKGKACLSFFNWELIFRSIWNYNRVHPKSNLNSKLKTVTKVVCRDKQKPVNPVISQDINRYDVRKDQGNLKICAFWLGGVGDAVMLGYLARSILRKYPNCVLDLIVRDSAQKDLFVFDYPKIRVTDSQKSWKDTLNSIKNKYDLIYEFRRYPQLWNKDNLKDISENPLYNNWSFAAAEILQTFDGTIFEYYAKQTGLAIDKSDLQIPIYQNRGKAIQNLYNLPQDYITIHNGVDGGIGKLKLWSKEKWEQVIPFVKNKLNTKIIYLGTETDEALDGVTKVKAKNLIDLAYILQGSKLHIGNEGGIIHLAHAVKTKSIVLFGPTKPSLYGYSDNVNLYGDSCESCWWNTGDWSTHCRELNLSCKNLDEIQPKAVCECIQKELESNESI